MYSILESRPLSAMNQSTFKCLKCDSIFVHSTPSSSKLKSKTTLYFSNFFVRELFIYFRNLIDFFFKYVSAAQIKCTICSSATVSLMEEPRPPEVRPLPDKPVSHSSSQSSIGKLLIFKLKLFYI